ncbi:hypothetical protein FHX37_0247 [Haloactinospora alba]|uniref:Uncharacterized protein n=1 Tax=Haloactinospora alba TaxID=405555 RepID=A0A543NF29_9ACTN|nr:hypothetical protein [Haloactinospora alba]TQN30370.1 hypothetical protein FHX37_0247 [Haloactinospora alba]
MADANTPYQKPSGTVRAGVWSTGCSNNWHFTAYLESSRWHGWATDQEMRWSGNGSRTMSAACTGVHDHRVRIQWDNGSTTGEATYGTARLHCG